MLVLNKTDTLNRLSISPHYRKQSSNKVEISNALSSPLDLILLTLTHKLKLLSRRGGWVVLDICANSTSNKSTTDRLNLRSGDI